MTDVKALLAMVMSVQLIGCAEWQRQQPGPPPVKPPTAYVKPDIEVISDLERVAWWPKSVTWRRFIAATHHTAFFVDHVNEVKGELLLHYSGDPKSYVDCGRVSNTVKTPGGDKTYEFAAASSFEQYQIMRKDKLYQVERRMSVEATVRVVFQSLEAEKTRIATASNYTLTRDQMVTGGAAKAQALTDTINFNSGDVGVFPNAATRCQPTGKLEREILDLLR